MVRGKTGAVLAALFMLAAPAAAVQSLSGAVRVIDGDTLEIAGTRVRLHAIDAPETGETCAGAAGDWACGARAARALAALAEGGLTCRGEGRDRYGRLVATCVDAAGRDVAETLVRAGIARAWPRYGRAYVPAEQAARAAGRGLWSAAPADEGAGAADGCTIKGNISSNGRIFHRPGDASYAATRIDRSRGERWFCSAAEARRAGWRPARR
jgi:endonuclease YncB( thermonuclease family)